MKNSWIYAFGFGGAFIALKLIAYLLDWQLHIIQPFVLLNMALLTSGIALFLYKKKRSQKESNILTDIKNGLSVGLPYTLLVSFFLFFYYKDIDPSFNAQKLAQIESQMDSTNEIAQIRKGNPALENKTDEEIRSLAKQNMSMMYNPQFTLSVSLLALLVYSTLNSLLIAVIYRKVVFKS